MTTTRPPTIDTWKILWRFLCLHPWLAIADVLMWILVGGVPVIVGAITGLIFDSLSGQSPATFELWTLLVLLMVVDFSGVAVAFIARFINFFHLVFSLETLQRKNMLERVLGLPGARARFSTSGEMLSRFDGDTEWGISVMQGWAVQNATTIVAGLTTMFYLAPRITMMVFLPLLFAVVLVNRQGWRLQQYRIAARRAGGEVTSFVGEIFGAVQTLQVANAISHVDSHFRQLNQRRRRLFLCDQLLTQGITGLMGYSQNVGVGIILLWTGQAMRAGTFSVGDFAYFMALLMPVAASFTFFGQLLTRQKGAAANLYRLTEVLQGAPAEQLVAPGPTYLRRNQDWPVVPTIAKTDEDQLERIEVCGLTYLYPESGRGIQNIDLTLERGSFTVITGQIGSGKTTLLRALLGLLPATGQITWNGQTVSDPAMFFVPPRSAYTPQTPYLFSDTLRQNILQGLPDDKKMLQMAMDAAVLSKDVALLEHGLDTAIGARGVRLSGGQLQRTAATRMFIRQPELLVFDDLSSALDVETEQRLWSQLFSRTEKSTCLVVSHRRTALQRADHIIVLKDGQVTGEGGLEQLLVQCEEMRRLWSSESNALGHSHDFAPVV